MKKFYAFFLFLNLLLVSGKNFIKNNPDCKNSRTNGSMLFANDSKNESEFEWDGIITGTKVIFPVAEGRFSWNLTEEFQNEFNYGINLNTGKYLKDASAFLKIGNLSYGGSLSRLSSPAISSSVTGFSTASTSASCITSSLPSYSSFSNDLGFSLQGNLQKGILKNGKASILFTPEQKFAASVYSKIQLFKGFYLNASIAGGIFSYDSSSVTTKNGKIKYDGGNHFCNLIQLGISNDFFYTLFNFGLFQNPIEKTKTDFSFRSESKLKFKKSVLNLFLFYNPNEYILSSSGTKNYGNFRGKITFQQTIPTSFFYIKTGFGTYSAIVQNDDEIPLKLSASVRLVNAFTTINFSFGTDFLFYKNNHEKQTDNKFERFYFTIKNSWYFDYISPSLTASFNFYPDENFEKYKCIQKITISASIPTLIKLKLNSSLSLTEKGGEFSKRVIDCYMTLKFSSRHFTVQCKTGFDFEF